MKGLLIIVLLLAILSAITNPNKDAHVKAIQDKIVAQSGAQDPLVQKGVSAVGGTLLNAMVDYRSYGVYSVTKANNKVITVGALGMVYVSETPKQ